MTVTIGYELLFDDLWLPVGESGLLLMRASLPLMVWAWVSGCPETRKSLVRTRTATGPLVLGVAVIVLLTISSVAHTEAETRSHGAQGAFVATLHDEAPPLRSSVWFREDWRKTAHLSLTLYLAAACCFAGWLLLRAWLAGRADAVNSGQAQT